MSQMEYNKGVLIELTQQQVNELTNDIDAFLDDNYDDYIRINNKVYKVQYTEKASELYQFCNVKPIENGYEFETYHYNGGGHWTELVENHIEKGCV